MIMYEAMCETATSNTRHQYDAASLPKADRRSLSVRVVKIGKFRKI